MMFRRKKKQGTDPAEHPAEDGFDENDYVDGFDENDYVEDGFEDDFDADDIDADDEEAGELPGRLAEGTPAGGPYDGNPPADGVQRVDLGGLQVPVFEGVELQVQLDEAGQVLSASLMDGQSTMQLGAFAAPKTSGIWEEVRAEIVKSIREAGRAVEEATGPYGPELRTALPDENGRPVPARFVGVDGPRWFLRALFSGAAGADPDAGSRLDVALRGVVVVRGGDAMPIRDPLPLKLPENAAAAADQAAEEAANGQPSLDPFERGPEITEVR